MKILGLCVPVFSGDQDILKSNTSSSSHTQDNKQNDSYIVLHLVLYILYN